MLLLCKRDCKIERVCKSKGGVEWHFWRRLLFYRLMNRPETGYRSFWSYVLRGSYVPCCDLRWLPTVLTVYTPEQGWRTKNEVFVSTLGLSSWHSQWRLATYLEFHFCSWVYCRLLPLQQTIAKITIFCYFPPAIFFRVSLGKILWNSTVLGKRFRTIL